MINNGWIKLYRQFYDSELAHKPPHYREVFFYLLAHANHADRRSSGTIIKRGQFHTLYEDIMDALHWVKGRSKVKYNDYDIGNALRYLKEAGIITTAPTTCGTIITICKYDTYQGGGSVEMAFETTLKQRSNNLINKNERKEEDNISNTLTKACNIPFVEFWNAYDKKVGSKTKIETKWNKLTDAEREAIINFIPEYKRATPEKRFRKNPESFLNNRSWEDELIFNNSREESSDNVANYHDSIPTGDLFGYSNEELRNHINSGKYKDDD